MRITSKQYAVSLFECVSDKNKKETEQIVKDFAKVLVMNNDINKHEAVVVEFLKIWNRKNKIIDAEITSANEIAKADIKKISDYIKDLSGAETVNLEMSLDESLIGGVIMKYGDKILDGSLKTRLNTLKNKMKN